MYFEFLNEYHIKISVTLKYYILSALFTCVIVTFVQLLLEEMQTNKATNCKGCILFISKIRVQ